MPDLYPYVRHSSDPLDLPVWLWLAVPPFALAAGAVIVARRLCSRTFTDADCVRTVTSGDGWRLP